MKVEVHGCGTFYIDVDTSSITIDRDVLEQLLQDREILRKLLELQKEVHEKRLAEAEAYFKALEKEKEKYDYDVDKYPEELIQKLKDGDYLDEEVDWIEGEVERINAVLKEIGEVRA